MKNKIKVSIIIPVYNGSNYMKEAIDSALNQTYKNIEVIVVNDGSKDDGKTDTIAKSYGNKIRYFIKKNGGVSTALNYGISKMTGDYFSWLSHDDLYKPDKVETQINYLLDNNLGNDVILFSDYYLIDKDGKVISECVKPHQEIVDKPEYALYRGHINGNSVLIPKEAFKKCGLFDEELRCSQDYLLWYEMMKKYKFVHIPKMLICSRVHGKQVTETSPLVDKEGNWFWTKIIDEMPIKRRIELEGSNYNFLSRMAKFLEETPYKKTQHYCEDLVKKEMEKVKEVFNKNKVSIIIPFYNRVELVKRSLKSALNQTYKNIEILLVNDGSKDDIGPIKKMVSEHKNVKLIDVKPNKGAANARNVGIKEATGDYIAFLDSDDEFLPEKVEKQLFRMVLENADVSYTKYTRMDDKGNKAVLPVNVVNGNPIPLFIYSCGVATPTVMIRRQYLVDNDFYYNPKLVIGEDTCFWLTILKHNTILGMEEPLTIVHTVSTSAANSIDKQIIGYKTILTFLLNDEYYSDFDYEIALLAGVYADICKKRQYEIDIKNGKKQSKIKRYYKDVIFTMKTYGTKSTVKRIYNKITRNRKN